MSTADLRSQLVIELTKLLDEIARLTESKQRAQAIACSLSATPNYFFELSIHFMVGGSRLPSKPLLH